VEVGGSNDGSEIELVGFGRDGGSESIDVITAVVASNDYEGVEVGSNVGKDGCEQSCSGVLSS